MAESEQEESFVFVDKRKSGAEPAAEEHRAAETDPIEEPESEPVEATVDDELFSKSASYSLAAYVVGLIASDAWQKLGLIADQTTGKVMKDLKQARFSIDCVAALVGVIEQSEADLPNDLRRDLQRVLADLRLNFVEKSRA